MKKIIWLVLVSGVLLSACQSSKITTGELAVKDAWARPAKPGDNGAAYLVIENGTSQEDRLLSAQTAIASTVELHLSQLEGDHMSMHPQEAVTLPAGEAVEFSPGGFHIMLVGLTRDLKNGETFHIQLTFERAGEKSVTVTVRDDVNDD
jgi:periplasmic copper chaperone A